MEKKRKLTIEIVTYAYSDILDHKLLFSILQLDRQQLVSHINDQRSIYSARAARRAVTDQFFDIKIDYNKFIERRLNSVNRAISLILTFAQTEISQKLGEFFEYETSHFAVSDILEILSTNDPLSQELSVEYISKKLYDIQRGNKGSGLLFKARSGEEVILESIRIARNRYFSRMLGRTRLTSGEILSVFVVSDGDILDTMRIQSVLDPDLRQIFERGSIQFYHIKSKGRTDFIDFYISRSSNVVFKRVYEENGAISVISDRVIDPSVLANLKR